MALPPARPRRHPQVGPFHREAQPRLGRQLPFPVLAGDRLLVNFLNCIALNPTTGETLWTAPTGMYWGTPTVTKIANVPVVFSLSAKEIIRLSDGQILQKNPLLPGLQLADLDGDTVYYFQIPGDHSLAGQSPRPPHRGGRFGQGRGPLERPRRALLRQPRAQRRPSTAPEITSTPWSVPTPATARLFTTRSSAWAARSLAASASPAAISM